MRVSTTRNGRKKRKNEDTLVDMREFKNWRKTHQYTQTEAGSKLGVDRSTIQNWEHGFTPIPTSVELACQVLTRRWKQRPEFGPVTLVYAYEPMWPEPDCPTRRVFVQCELCTNNEVAIQQALRLSKNPSFRNPLIIEHGGGIIWSIPDLLRECDKRRKRRKRKRVKDETAASGATQDRHSRTSSISNQDNASSHQTLKKDR
jgi:DNA-binding XRE family transcriptional regulator